MKAKEFTLTLFEAKLEVIMTKPVNKDMVNNNTYRRIILNTICLAAPEIWVTLQNQMFNLV